MARCIVMLADGLRPDAIGPAAPRLAALGHAWCRVTNAQTVTPSVTVAALASLATGVGPATHGLVEPGLGFLSRLGALRPVARELARHRIPSLVVAGELAPRNRPVAWTLARCAGATKLVSARNGATGIAQVAVRHLADMRDGFAFLYLPDCDRAGHASGWMSTAYLEAVREIDAAIGIVAGVAGDSVLIVLSDHGGGGVDPRDHDAEHPLNRGIPIVLAGGPVRRGCTVTRPVSLLDIPPTILDCLGVPVPGNYEGTVLADAFVAGGRRAVA